jgi:sugar lactone lactonase YvrE
VLDRLIFANSPNNWTMNVDYDAHGNRRSFGGTDYTYDPNNRFRLTSMTGGPNNMEYDNNGNMYSATGASITYTPSNQIGTFTGSSGTISFAYDGDDWRVKKVVNGAAPTYFFRGPDGRLLTEWTNSNPAIVKDYVYAGSRLIGVYSVQLNPLP